jgi:uncharacterized protein YoaH (UPF0181 family)
MRLPALSHQQQCEAVVELSEGIDLMMAWQGYALDDKAD